DGLPAHPTPAPPTARRGASRTPGGAGARASRVLQALPIAARWLPARRVADTPLPAAPGVAPRCRPRAGADRAPGGSVPPALVVATRQWRGRDGPRGADGRGLSPDRRRPGPGAAQRSLDRDRHPPGGQRTRAGRPEYATARRLLSRALVSTGSRAGSAGARQPRRAERDRAAVRSDPWPSRHPSPGWRAGRVAGRATRLPARRTALQRAGAAVTACTALGRAAERDQYSWHGPRRGGRLGWQNGLRGDDADRRARPLRSTGPGAAAPECVRHRRLRRRAGRLRPRDPARAAGVRGGRPLRPARR